MNYLCCIYVVVDVMKIKLHFLCVSRIHQYDSTWVQQWRPNINVRRSLFIDCGRTITFRILLTLKICNWSRDSIVRLSHYYHDSRQIKTNFFFTCIKNVVGACYNKKYELHASTCINRLIVDQYIECRL